MKYWPAIVSALVALAVAIPVIQELVPGIRLFERVEATPVQQEETSAVSREAVGDVEVDRLFIGETGVTAPAGPGRSAHLTLDPKVQRAADAAVKARRIPHGGSVLMDVRTGEILAHVSRRGGNDKNDVITTATVVGTDIFKLVTAAALVNVAGATASTPICHRDAGKKLELEDLIEDEQKDTWCPSLAEVLARNLDAPLARMAYRELDKEPLEKTAQAFGFGTPVPFDLPVQASRFSVPSTDEGLIRAALGAESVTMSAMQGLVLASVVASQGMMVQPVLVRKVEAAGGRVVYAAPKQPRYLRRVLSQTTAEELKKMMFETTEIGEGFRSFHDDTGHPVFGEVKVAGVVGAEAVVKDAEQVTWFVGFAPVQEPQVAIAAVVRNRRGASGHATALAVDILRGYFESRKGDAPNT